MTQTGITIDEYEQRRRERIESVAKLIAPPKYVRPPKGRRIGKPPTPVTIDGVYYPSKTAAAKALGISDRGLRRILAMERNTR